MSRDPDAVEYETRSAVQAAMKAGADALEVARRRQAVESITAFAESQKMQALSVAPDNYVDEPPPDVELPRLTDRPEPGCDDVPMGRLLSGDRAAERRREIENSFAPAHKNRYAFIRGPDLVRKKITNPLWLVNRLLPESGVCVIGGEPKATKTWCALEMGMALATGTPAFGEYEARDKKHVAVFFAEDGERSVKARIAALADSRHMEQEKAVEDMDFICRGNLDLLNKEDMADVVAACKAMPNLGLLIMDPLRDLHSANEDSSTEMSKVTHALRALRDELGCALLFVHHAHKSGKDTEGRRPGQRLRGSSAIHGAVDAGFYMSGTDTDGKSYWHNDVCVEIKEGAGAGVIKLTLNLDNDDGGTARGGSWVVDRAMEPERGKPADDAVLLALTDDPVGIRKLRDVVHRDDGPVRAALERLRESGKARQITVNGVVKGWALAPYPPPKPEQKDLPIRPIRDPSADPSGGSLGPNPSGPSGRLYKPDGGRRMGGPDQTDTENTPPIRQPLLTEQQAASIRAEIAAFDPAAQARAEADALRAAVLAHADDPDPDRSEDED